MAEGNPSNKTMGMTPRETEILIACLRNVKGGDLQIEFNTVAEELGLKDSGSARTQWGKVKTKLFGKKLATAAAANADEEPATAKSKTPRKANAPTATPKAGKKTPKSEATIKEEDDDADGNSSAATAKNEDTPMSTTSTGKKRGRKTKAEKEAEAAANGNDGGDEEEEKPAKKPRKTPVKKTTSEGDAAAEPPTPTKPKKAAPRKSAANKTAANKTAATDPEEDDKAAAAAPVVTEEEKAKKEKLAADAQLANNVLTGKKVVNPTIPSQNGSTAAEVNEEHPEEPVVDATVAVANGNGHGDIEQGNKEVIATVVTEIVAPTTA
ncbi:hypothetical protein PV11_09857 [Exophiala sideris]|uniref:Uncharacterized protein n=1 Tax=Exophiala sideris TaxID=1016849 RepID=A0A0D1Y5G7_9EURO|nr:hypothetical protein PV11_09857 [Exophiala sideris]